ncbi:aldehyde dehydrogenase family protein [Propionicicella superfundia]|uniref:aldehyde dehydrogenase family protein n=1 Tax=Propionicicella superfundia TaxID=348582 RepID=UPI0003F563C3|nr:aldehyde dehydrogenase family protein [Propionicicella superfundia]
MAHGQLTELVAGMRIPYGGDRYVTVGEDLAAAFSAGDRLFVVQDSGDLIHVPERVATQVTRSVDAALDAFTALRGVPRPRIRDFYRAFATHLEAAWDGVAAANADDVARAERLGRSTTRLVVSDRMRADMISGLREWAELIDAQLADPEHDLVARVGHGDWGVDVRSAPLGVVAFVFEGRPNVLVDAAGVLATGNAAVLRIGGDALGTAQAIVDGAITPALTACGLPAGALSLVPVRERSAGWALFSDPRLALAVVRGSGAAVMQLSSIARQTGVPVSAHGTGGAWIVAAGDAPLERLSGAVRWSLDRKVCNTVNVVVLPRSAADVLLPVVVAAADEAAAARGGEAARLHVADGSQEWVDAGEFDRLIDVARAEGVKREPRADVLPVTALGREWEWENTPELSLLVVDDVTAAADAFNEHSPQFIASLITTDPEAFADFRDRVNAPFVGDGFTRWVDGQYTLNQPELGLSNWERGRLLGRAAVLTGADLSTRRMYAHHDDPQQHR